MSSRPITIVSALPEEIRPLVREWSLARNRSGARLRIWKGTRSGRSVVVACTGSGSQRAEHGLTSVLQQVDPAEILFVGIAGGLTKDLSIGDVVVAERIQPRDNQALVTPRADWYRRLVDLEGIRTATFVSSLRVVTSPEEKLTLGRRHRVSSEPVVVDMESESWASVANLRAIPYALARAVSDTVEDQLPAVIEGAMRDDGSISKAKVLAGAAREPSAVPHLRQLRDRVLLCAERLKETVEEAIG